MARLFVAIPLSPSLKQRLLKIQPPRTRGITPVASDNLHLTLQFIGEAEPQAVIDALMSVSARSFDLEFTELSRFQKGVIWLGVRDSPELKALQLKVVQALVKAGFEMPAKRFLPHITLARYKRHVPAEMIELLLKESASELPREKVLAFGVCSSQVEDDVLSYRRLRAFPLAE